MVFNWKNAVVCTEYGYQAQHLAIPVEPIWVGCGSLLVPFWGSESSSPVRQLFAVVFATDLGLCALRLNPILKCFECVSAYNG